MELISQINVDGECEPFMQGVDEVFNEICEQCFQCCNRKWMLTWPAKMMLGMAVLAYND